VGNMPMRQGRYETVSCTPIYTHDEVTLHNV